MAEGLVRVAESGLYCEAGDFYIDPWAPVPRAVLTHAHSDHATFGCGAYLTATSGRTVLETRLGPGLPAEYLDYGEMRLLGGVRVSLHAAGHILGSSQVRIERGGEVWAISGDYKTSPDPTCAPFEPLRCHTFITESTFGLPIYRWPAQTAIWERIEAWRSENREQGRASILFAYPLGKAQRILAGVNPDAGPIYCHGAVERLNEAYRAAGVSLPETSNPMDEPRGTDWSRALILAPPSANGTPWLRRFGDLSTAFASGWMLVRGTRRRRSVDRGFALSDHADWPGLLETIRATGAERVLPTHGASGAIVRFLREQGYEAEALSTRFSGEQEDPE
jgi:putative mRNA 3-end processing factor